MAEHRTLNPQVEGSIPSAPIRAISHEVALFFCPPPAAQALALFRLRSIRARFALFRCAPYGLYAGYVLGLAPLRAYAVGYGHSALFRLRSIRAPYASAIVRALKRRARNARARIAQRPRSVGIEMRPKGRNRKCAQTPRPQRPGLESRNARDRWAKKIPHSDEERGIGERCANLNYVLQYPPLTQVKLALSTVQSLLLLHETLQDPPAHTMPLGQSAALLHG